MDKPDRVREVAPRYEPQTGNLTYDDYLRMPAGLRYELVEGQIRTVPSPRQDHQSALLNLATALRMWIKTTGEGKVLMAPFDVLLSQDTVVQPDILFISKARQAIAEQPYVNGAPDLVVEILSPSTENWDRITKRRIYSRYGVREFWLVDPEMRSIEVSRQKDGQLVAVEMLREGSTLASPLLPGFEVGVREVFEE